MKQCILLNNMNNTLDLLDELLEHDPGSKIFFPLARLHKKQGNFSRAAEIIRKGIKHHPDYLEAQLFFIDLLYETGELEEAESIAHNIYEKFVYYEKFWLSLRGFFEKKGDAAMMLSAFMFELNSRGEGVDILTLLRDGISRYCVTQDSSTDIVEPEHDLDAEEVTQFCINSGIKTKTMAKLLSAQGEYEQAVSIYNELLATCSDSIERTELLAQRARVQILIEKSTQQDCDKNTKLYNLLNSLASRLEHKHE